MLNCTHIRRILILLLNGMYRVEQSAAALLFLKSVMSLNEVYDTQEAPRT